jgi:hypothetical protein
MLRVVVAFCLACLLTGCVAAQDRAAVQLSLDTSEADQALQILREQKTHGIVTDSEWQRLFGTVPYQWLKAREASIGAPFTDEQFQVFLLSPASLEMQSAWEETLAEMKQADMQALGTGVLSWLPAGGSIHARVFSLIKPRHNSFVWTKPDREPAIFLYLERQTQAKFENTVAHECHHIGLQSLERNRM